MLFLLGTEQYAVESRLLRAVQPPKGLTAVPCTPPYVAGILNVRGDIVTVLDLGIALGLAGASREAERAGVLLVELPQVRVGLLVDEVLGVRPLALDALDRAFSGREAVRGVAESSIVLLDLEHLLTGGRFDVLEDVSERTGGSV
jgi:purine-binding chemotaxis protein CheW